MGRDSELHRRCASIVVPALALGCLTGTGCATLVHGRTQGISVTSEPPGAEVYDGSDLVGLTPARFILSRKRSDIVLRVQKEDYAPATIALKQKASPWLAGDLSYGALNLYGGWASAAVTVATYGGIDLLTGAAYNLKPSKVNVTLMPLARDPKSAPGIQEGATTPITEEERADAKKIAREWVQAASRRRK